MRKTHTKEYRKGECFLPPLLDTPQGTASDEQELTIVIQRRRHAVSAPAVVANDVQAQDDE